ncbi:hypothetical protein [Streptomyces collinus]|uniref:hypothetical protein n=1 Tax=Streptomyces collinus TaxID=42684 RepID=UPI002941C611|nr:hypothetical protein [Streptomyces collinus]
MADREPRTWLGYARNATRHEPGDDEQVEQWLEQARADAALAGDADTLADAWQQLAADHRAFLNAYAADCPEVEAYNGTRDAVRRSAGSPQRQVLDEVSAAVGKVSHTRSRDWVYGAPPELDAGALVCGVWSAARSRGHSRAEAADMAYAAAAEELNRARVVDVTRLPTPPRTAGSAHESPAAWADAELAAWWPQAVRALCARLEEDFEAESAATAARLLLVRDWPLTGVRDAPVAYLATSPVLGPLVPHGYRDVDNYVSWNGGDSAGPSYSAVIAAPAHLVAKLEKEQAAQPSRYQPRFTAGGPVTGTPEDLQAAEELLRAVFPLLPGDGAGEPAIPSAAVQQQRRARHAQDGLRLTGEEERLYRLAHSLSDGYRCWVPGRPEELEQLASWLRWTTLRVDVLCGSTGRAEQWASVFGTLEAVTDSGIRFSPGGRHRALHIPWHRIVALTGAPNWDRGHGVPDLWRPYEPVAAPPPPDRPTSTRSAGLRALPTPDGAA